MKTQTDIARPENFDPADYCADEIIWYYTGWSEELHMIIAEDNYGTPVHVERAVWDALDAHESGDMIKCWHCGQPHKYGAGTINRTTGDVVLLGNQCASNLFYLADRAAYAKRELERKARFQKHYAAGVDGDPELHTAFEECDHEIVRDIKSRLRKWGDISDKQIALVKKLWREAARKEEKQAERIAAIDPVVEGRRTVEGTIVSVKTREGRWGTTLKMLVEEPTGARVWGTLPAALAHAEIRVAIDGDEHTEFVGVNHGDRVRFVATVDRSDDDPTFGFFKRPTNAEMVERDPDELEAYLAPWGEYRGEA